MLGTVCVCELHCNEPATPTSIRNAGPSPELRGGGAGGKTRNMHGPILKANFPVADLYFNIIVLCEGLTDR